MSSNKFIPLSIPNLSGKEWDYIKECLDTNWVSSVGSFVDRFEKEIAEYTGSKNAVAVVNGTAALHLSLQLAGVGFGDYVLVPSLTFIASANAVKYVGADPILVDVDPETWQLDLKLLSEFLERKSDLTSNGLILKNDGRKIKAIMPVYMLGNLCDMSELVKLSEKFHLKIIEDATESIGATFKGKHAGTFGLFGCLSFNGNKMMTTGGGGMILTNDDLLAQKAKHLSTQAKADSFEYFHDEIGYNYRLVNILAAMGVAQLENLPKFLKRKAGIAAFYKSQLKDLPGISFQKTQAGAVPNNWLFTILTNRQKELIERLNNCKIQVRKTWMPIHKMPVYSHARYISDFDHSFDIYNRSLSLPCSSGISDEELERVVAEIKRNFFR